MGNKDNYYWYKSHGICVNCGQNNTYKEHVFCLKCMMNRRDKAIQSYYDTVTPEKKVHYREMAKDIYYKRKKNGVCVSCGKRKSVNGETRCIYCKKKKRRKNED